MSGRRRRNQQASESAILDFQVDGFESTRAFPSGDATVKFNFSDLDGLIQKFSGDNSVSVKRWLDEFEAYANTFRWNELQRYVFCKRSLAGPAKLFVDCESKPLTYRDLKSALYTEFHPRLNAADVHKKLRERTKKPTETVREYLYQMVNIAAQADVDEESIISYVIDGIKDSAMNKAILYGAKTVGDLKEKLLIYEKIRGESTNISNFESTVKNSKSTSKFFRGDQKRGNKLKRYCYNCGSAEHESHSCPEKAKGPKCFKCNQFGHKREDCGKKLETTVNTIRKNEARCSIRVNGTLLEGLIDTGSEICILKESLIKDVKPKYFSKEHIISIAGLGANIYTKGSCIADIEVDGAVFAHTELHIVDDEHLKFDVVIGMNLLNKAVVTIAAGTIKISKEQSRSHDEYGEDISKDEKTVECFITKIDPELMVEPDRSLPCLSHLQNKDIINEVKELVQNYLPLEPPESPVTMKIVPLDDEPIYRTPRRYPPYERQIIQNQIKEWLEKGVIRESVSDYSSQVVLVKKKDNSYRLCIDYRAINKKIHKDRYPIPNIEDQIDKLEGSMYFTMLDLENGFFHVRVEEESRKFTSFVTQDGQYEFLRVPFGLCNSPSVFQKYINYVFRQQIQEGIAIIYIDDIVIPSSTINEGLDRLRKVLQEAARNGLKIKWSKCQFLQREIDYLGHHIREGKVSPSIEKTKAVLNFPVPKTTKQLRSFLGLASYFRKFVADFAVKAKPLTRLLKKEEKFYFGDEQHQAFRNLKEALSSQPVLKIFRYGAITELHTDASKHGYGAVLLQKDTEDGQLHPVYYMSRTTTTAEKNYSSYELEVLAVIEAIKKFRVYLLGHEFKLVTDCKAFEGTIKKKDLTTRVARWALLLEEFNFKVEHRAGSRLRHVDALSRSPVVMSIGQDNEFLRRLEETQRRDERLCAIIELLKSGPFKDYVIHHNVLYKNVNGNMLFVVPDSMKNQIIKDVHERGHFHAKKMKEIIDKEYYIPDLQHRIERHVSSCVRCILAERKYGKQEGLLQPIPKGERPLDTLHVDHLGPLQATKKNYRYIFAIMDGFTKYCWLFPTKTLNAEEAIQKLETVAETFGYPERLIADRGGAFISKQFQDYCKNHDVKLHLITAGVARGNGQIERLHSIVITGLTKLSLDDADKWYTHVKPFQRILNSTVQRAIGTTPFQLLVGVRMKTDQDTAILKIIEEEYKNSFEEERNTLREKAKLEIARIQDENRRTYNRKRQEATKYSVGDLVAVERTQFGVGLKIKPKFLGPYRITAVKGFDRYQVEKVGDHEGPRTTSTSADKMKRWAENEDSDVGPELIEDEPVTGGHYSSGPDE